MSQELPPAPPQKALSAGADQAVQFQEDDVQAIAYFKEAHSLLRRQIGKVIVGQEKVIDELLIAIFTRSHALLVGVPGLAKTLLISTLAQALNLDFKRIQFTPDLMPSDITGTEVIYQDPLTGARQFKFLPGPIFANVILADEINRTPPRRRPLCSRRCRSARLPQVGWTTNYPIRSSSSPRKIPWSRRARIRCRRRNSIASCS